MSFHHYTQRSNANMPITIPFSLLFTHCHYTHIPIFLKVPTKPIFPSLLYSLSLFYSHAWKHAYTAILHIPTHISVPISHSPTPSIPPFSPFQTHYSYFMLHHISSPTLQAYHSPHLGYPSPSASDPSSIIPYETQLRRAKSLIPRVSLISTSLNDEKEEGYGSKHNHKEGDSSGFISTMLPFNDFRKGTPKQ